MEIYNVFSNDSLIASFVSRSKAIGSLRNVSEIYTSCYNRIRVHEARDGSYIT